MNKKLIISLTVIASIAMTAGIVNAAASHNVTSNFGPSGDIFQVDGTMKMSSAMIGAQDIGGVTYFNGSIVNETTTGGADNPVTFGDNVRIDGRVYRGATAGTGDAMPFIVNDNMEVVGSLTIGSLAGAGIISSANIVDNAITTLKIADATIDTVDIADNTITPAKINGTGGANLPIAYGWCNSDGTKRGGTSNVSCSWNAGSSFYEITINGVAYDYRDYIAFAQPVDAGMISDVSSVSNNLVVGFTTHGGASGQQVDFQFIVYDM